MAVNCIGVSAYKVAMPPSITVEDKDGSSVTYYDKPNSDAYLVVTKDADGNVESRLVSKNNALKGLIAAASDEDTSTITCNTGKNKQTIHANKDGSYTYGSKTTVPGHLGAGIKRITREEAAEEFVDMLEDINIIEGQKIYNTIEYCA